MIEFDLDITGECDSKLKEKVVRAGGTIKEVVDGPNGQMIIISAPDMATAGDCVDAVYGVNDGSRDDNEVYIKDGLFSPMTDLYMAWAEMHGIEDPGCAEELRDTFDADTYQYRWLSGFIMMWEAHDEK